MPTQEEVTAKKTQTASQLNFLFFNEASVTS